MEEIKQIVINMEFIVLVIVSTIGIMILGLFTRALDRKMSARFQWRIGPPITQPFIDIIKLLGKETLIPKPGRRTLFLWAPLLGFAATAAAGALLVASISNNMTIFPGDLIVLLYLLSIPSIMFVLGASSGGSPHAAIGGGREIKLLVGYELPFILSLLVAVIHTGGSLNITSILRGQGTGEMVVANVSGLLAFVISLICIVAKIGLVPFDQAEAETEIMGGILVSYSGPPLALMLLTKAMLYAVMPILLISVFWGGIDVSLAGITSAGVKYVFLVMAMIVIRNTNPRLRIDQALVFFWGVLSPLAVAVLVLAITGSANGIGWL